MRLLVAITDSEWFTFLSRLAPDEVNFWQPSGGSGFRALSPGEPLLFKLHSPHDFIVGGGFFSHFSVLPVSFAWNAFKEKNGASTQDEMRARIEHYRRVPPTLAEDYLIGCILPQRPFFLPQSAWIPLQHWAKSIVRYKGFVTDEQAGRELWSRVEAQLIGLSLPDQQVASGPQERFGQPQFVLPRLGQGAFRVIVTDSYRRQCALTRSHVLHVLDAAHIKPYSLGGTHRPDNGLLLRQDLHTLFDRGYVTVTPEYRVEVSRRIKEEFDNGKEYYQLHGQSIHLPDWSLARPSREMLSWHNEKVYRP